MIIVPFINPLRYKEQGVTSSYQTKYFDKHFFEETIRPFEQVVSYRQPWQTNDRIHQQLFSDETAMSIEYINEDTGDVVVADVFTAVSFNVLDGVTIYTYEHKQPLSIVGNGNFFARITAGARVLESNPFNICIDQPGTVSIKYSNSTFHEDVIWEFGIEMYLRVNGYVNHNMPKRFSNTYEDQVYNTTILKAVPYNTYTFITESEGMPTYMIDILNRIMTCDSTRYDGKYLTVPEGTDWEEKTEEYYPMRGWGIDLRESENAASLELREGAVLIEDAFHLLTEDDETLALEG
jgi:hypothetical protein